MIRTLSFLLLAVLAAPTAARAEGESDTAESARKLLDSIEHGKDGGARLEQAKKLISLEPTPIAVLKKFLARERSASDADRRQVLAAIDAEVPDQKGRFPSQTRRLTDKEKKAQDERDWLAELAEVKGSLSAMGEVFADVAAIHALAESKLPEAATVILDFAFTDTGLVYRDDCGRKLRAMSPYSLPALIRGSEDRRHAYSLRHYAQYQLERLDREAPRKAMRDAVTDDLKVEVLRAFAESRYREAVYTVLDYVNHVSPRVRKAARDAWIRYAKSKPWRVPKRKLKLTGGKLSDEKEPLWLDHKELQVIAIRRKLEKLTGKAPGRKATLLDMSKQLFTYYDDQRRAHLDKTLDQALSDYKDGKLEDAAATLDQILVQDPEFHRKEEMVPVYLAYGAALEKKKKWREAALAYGKAHAMDPDGAKAKEALGKHHYARGKALEAEGGDASAEFARALEVDPDHQKLGGNGRDWMLYAGVGGGAGGLLLLVLGLFLRRRR